MDLFDEIAALRREGRTFVLATVVYRHAPVSAHLGDRALVFPDGRMQGFVGGACSREIIRQQALEALKTRQPRLVSIQPSAIERNAAAEGSDERVVVPMTCASEGAIDVYVEPFVQARRLIVAGATPVAAALARLARAMEYDVVRAIDPREQQDVEAEAVPLGITVVPLDALTGVLEAGAAGGVEQAAVVVTQGHYDEDALERCLRSGVPYVGLVASHKRGATVVGLLKDGGVPGVDAIRYPAGLDLGARTPAEVALSIVAEIVRLHPSGVPARAPAVTHESAPTDRSSAPATAIDPVCGMSVTVAGARYTADVDGVTYYFCCAGCRSKFGKNPQQFQASH